MVVDKIIYFSYHSRWNWWIGKKALPSFIIDSHLDESIIDNGRENQDCSY